MGLIDDRDYPLTGVRNAIPTIKKCIQGNNKKALKMLLDVICYSRPKDVQEICQFRPLTSERLWQQWNWLADFGYVKRTTVDEKKLLTFALSYLKSNLQNDEINHLIEDGIISGRHEGNDVKVTLEAMIQRAEKPGRVVVFGEQT